MARRNQPGGGDLGINLTPMIDCTFQLIIFFIIATRFSSAAIEPLLLHQPLKSQAQDDPSLMDNPNRVIVNITSEAAPERGDEPEAASRASAYVIMGERIEPLNQVRLIEIFKQKKAAAEETGAEGDFHIEVRGDKRVSYAYIDPVLKAAGRAGISKMNITATVGSD